MSEFNAEVITEITEKLREASGNIASVYESGKTNGERDGRQKEYDDFWDAFQSKGQRDFYDAAFMGHGDYYGWKYGENYRPKYPIKPLSAVRMFAYSNLPYDAIAAVDFSNCKNFSMIFMYYSIHGGNAKWLPRVDMRKATDTSFMFAWAHKLEEIEELESAESTPYSTNMFVSCNALREIRFSGTIGQSGLSFKDCKSLSRASIESVIGHLSGNAVGKSVTFSELSVENAFSSDEWTSLVATKPNWTITLS